MANKSETYDIIFDAVDKLTPGVKKIEKSFEGLQKDIDKTNKKFLDLEAKEFDKPAASISEIADSMGELSQVAAGLTAPFAAVTGSVLAVDAALAAAAVSLLSFSSEGKKSTENLRASLGILPEEAEKFGAIAKDVYADKLSESVEEGAQAVKDAFLILKETSEESLNASSRAALLLKKTFDADVSDSISTAKTLMDNFGLTSEQSFDLLAKGFQKGLDRSGDFLDTINEYSTQFKSGGASATQFFSLLESGLAGGALGADKAADAFKEFRVRIQDGSKTTKEALELIGIGADDFQKKLSSGAFSAADAFELVVKKLKETGDSSTQIQAGVGLLGTQFEDLGNAAATSLSLAGKGFDDTAKSIENLKNQNESAADAFEKAWRKANLAITNSEVFKEFENQIVEFFGNIGTNFEEAFKKVDLQGVQDALKDLFSALNNNLSGIFGDIDLTTVEGLSKAIETIVDTVESIIDISTGLSESFQPVFNAFGEFIDYINDMDADTKKFIGEVAGAGTQLGIFFASFAGGAFAIGKAQTAITGLSTTLSGTFSKATLTAKLGAVGLGAGIGILIGNFINSFEPVQRFTQELFRLVDIAATGSDIKIGEDVEATRAKAEALLKYRRNIAAVAEEAKEAKQPLESLGKTIEEIPKDKEIGISLGALTEQTKASVEDIQLLLSDIESKKELEIRLSDASLEDTQTALSRIEQIDQELLALTDQKNTVELDIESQLNKKAATPEEIINNLDTVNANIDALTAEKKTIEIGLDTTAVEEIENLNKEIRSITEQENLLEFETAPLDDKGNVKDFIIKQTSEGKIITLRPEFDQPAVEKAEATIDDLTEDKKFLLELQSKQFEEDTKRINTLVKESGETARKELDVTAEVRIAEAEANLKKFESALESTSGLIDSLAGSTADLFGSFGDLDLSQQWLLRDAIEQQLDIQREQADLNRELIDLELEKLRLQNQILGDPKRAILQAKIDPSISPALDLVLREILKATRIYGLEYGFEQLIEVPLTT